jgi:hypothetical protein
MSEDDVSRPSKRYLASSSRIWEIKGKAATEKATTPPLMLALY